MPIKSTTKIIEGEFILSKNGENTTFFKEIDIIEEKSDLPQEIPVKTLENASPVLGSQPKHEKKFSSNAFTKEEKEKTPHFYSALLHHPKNITFENQEDDEDIILLIRKHFATNFPWIFSSFLLILLPLILMPFYSTLFPFINLSKTTILVSILFYYTLVFGLILLNFTIWYFQVALITNKRIVDMNISGILFRSVSETRLDLIQDVSYTQSGAIRSFFDYGDVFIQTAGNVPNFEFNRAPEPAHVMHVIGELIGHHDTI